MTSLQAFSPYSEQAASISLVLLNLSDVHGVVKFINDFNGFGLRLFLRSKLSFKLYMLTTPDLHLNYKKKNIFFYYIHKLRRSL